MKLVINNQQMEFSSVDFLSDILRQQKLSQQGIAVAVNAKVISKAEWDKFQLKENDSILIIKATQGG